MDIDYRRLLKLYINHVASAEGAIYLNAYDRNVSSKDGVVFSEKEWTELEKISLEPLLDTD